jgi:hypothetical protein
MTSSREEGRENDEGLIPGDPVTTAMLPSSVVASHAGHPPPPPHPPRWSSRVAAPAAATGERISSLRVDRSGERQPATCVRIEETVGLGGCREER